MDQTAILKNCTVEQQSCQPQNEKSEKAGVQGQSWWGVLGGAKPPQPKMILSTLRGDWWP